MKVHYSKSVNILARFLDEVVAPKTPTFKMIGLSLYLAVHSNEIEESAKAFADKDGFLDIDLLKNTADKALDRWGEGKCLIPGLNWNADKEDIEVLYKIAKDEAK